LKVPAHETCSRTHLLPLPLSLLKEEMASSSGSKRKTPAATGTAGSTKKSGRGRSTQHEDDAPSAADGDDVSEMTVSAIVGDEESTTITSKPSSSKRARTANAPAAAVTEDGVADESTLAAVEEEQYLSQRPQTPPPRRASPARRSQRASPQVRPAVSAAPTAAAAPATPASSPQIRPTVAPAVPAPAATAAAPQVPSPAPPKPTAAAPSQFQRPAAAAASTTAPSSSQFSRAQYLNASPRPAAAAAATGVAGDAEAPVAPIGSEDDVIDGEKYANSNDAFKPSTPEEKLSSIWWEDYANHPEWLAHKMIAWQSGNKKDQQQQSFRIVDTRTGHVAKIRSPVMRMSVYDNVPFGNMDMKVPGATPSKYAAANIFMAKARYGMSFRAYSKHNENGCDPNVVGFARFTEKLGYDHIKEAVDKEPDYRQVFGQFAQPVVNALDLKEVSQLPPDKKQKLLDDFYKGQCSHTFRRGPEGAKVAFLHDTLAVPEFSGATTMHVTTKFSEYVPRKSGMLVMLENIKKQSDPGADVSTPAAADAEDAKHTQDVNEAMSKQILDSVNAVLATEKEKHNKACKPGDQREKVLPVQPKFYTIDKATGKWRLMSYYEVVQLEAANDFLVSFIFKVMPAKPTVNKQPNKPSTAPGTMLEMESAWIVDHNIGKKHSTEVVARIPAGAQPFRPLLTPGEIGKQLMLAGARINKAEYKLLS
jgi:hypothetical protein